MGREYVTSQHNKQTGLVEKKSTVERIKQKIHKTCIACRHIFFFLHIMVNQEKKKHNLIH